VDFDIREAHAYANAHSAAALKELFARHRQRPATWSLPVKGPQSEWTVDRAELAALAKTASSLGAARCVTWVPSWHESRPLKENRAYHLARFREIGGILAAEGCSIGLEFLGPKELLKRGSHAFIHSMGNMLEFAHDVGTGNIGLLVDAYHLYTSGGTWDDLKAVPVKDIIQVHINDAHKGIARDELPDTNRCLPLETGVIDLAGFIKALSALGYDGPVVTEPFSASLNALAAQNAEAAARQVSEAMDKLWKLSGLG
jgi:sugar phosphate isomerase/epimerase